jgi:hypothetical protein
MSIQSINPATGEVLENFHEMSTSEIDGILEAVYTTFHEWRSPSVCGACAKNAASRRSPACGERKICADHGPRDGKTDRPGRSGSREVRVDL